MEGPSYSSNSDGLDITEEASGDDVRLGARDNARGGRKGGDPRRKGADPLGDPRS